MVMQVIGTHTHHRDQALTRVGNQVGGLWTIPVHTIYLRSHGKRGLVCAIRNNKPLLLEVGESAKHQTGFKTRGHTDVGV